MKKNKAIAIFCLLFMILIVFAICSSVYLSKRENSKDIIILAANKNYGLTKEQVEQELNKMKSTPTYDELVSLAKRKYGMNEEIGPISLKNENGEYLLDMFGKDMGDKIGIEVKKLIDTAYNDAQTILKQHMDKLNEVAEELLRKEKINEEGFKKFFEEE